MRAAPKATADGSALLYSLPTEESFFDLLRQTDNFSGDLRVISGKSVTFVASNLKTDRDMPQLFTLFGLRFMFYSNDHEPIHVHVVKGGAEARFQVQPEVTLMENRGLKPAELKLAESIVEENKEIIAARWNEFFKNKK